MLMLHELEIFIKSVLIRAKREHGAEELERVNKELQHAEYYKSVGNYNPYALAQQQIERSIVVLPPEIEEVSATIASVMPLEELETFIIHVSLHVEEEKTRSTLTAELDALGSALFYADQYKTGNCSHIESRQTQIHEQLAAQSPAPVVAKDRFAFIASVMPLQELEALVRKVTSRMELEEQQRLALPLLPIFSPLAPTKTEVNMTKKAFNLEDATDGKTSSLRQEALLVKANKFKALITKAVPELKGLSL